MNEWMNEWMNARIERINDWMKEGNKIVYKNTMNADKRKTEWLNLLN